MAAARIRKVRTIEGDAGESLVLRERDGNVELLAGRVVLLSSAALASERAFGALAGSLGRPPHRVLVGGLGFGATLRGALDACPASARVVVAERVAAVVRVARDTTLAGLPAWLGAPLDDPRASVVHEDVGSIIRRGAGDLDAILLDVDNGPHWASFRDNAGLYTPAGLAAARDALATGGMYAVWSGYPADAFLARLRAAGFVPRVVPLPEHARAYIGVKP